MGATDWFILWILAGEVARRQLVRAAASPERDR